MSIIQKTKNYSQFKIFPANRDLTPNKVLNSIKEKDMLSSHPIIVTKDLYVIDGQHRLNAAKTLGLFIYYIVDENLSEADIPKNQIQKTWELRDYLKFYKSKKADYDFVDEVHEKSQLQVNFIMHCCSNTKNNLGVKFRQGKFKIDKDRKYLTQKFEQFCEILEICQSICKGITNIQNSGKTALWKIICHPDYSQKRMMTATDNYRQGVIDTFRLKDMSVIRDKLKNDVYNKGLKNSPFMIKD